MPKIVVDEKQVQTYQLVYGKLARQWRFVREEQRRIHVNSLKVLAQGKQVVAQDGVGQEDFGCWGKRARLDKGNNCVTPGPGKRTCGNFHIRWDRGVYMPGGGKIIIIIRK